MTAPASLRSLNHKSFRAQVALARRHVEYFLPLVMRDEETGLPIQLAPVHRAWHELATHYNRLVIWAHVEAGKSQQLSIGRVLWALGKNPSLRVAIVSNTYGQAEKVVRTIARYIAKSPEFAAVFPKCRPGLPWSSNMLTVTRPGYPKEPSVQAFGVHGNVTGARIDMLVVDDILDPENTRSVKQRDEVWSWYNAALVGRLTANARVIVVGTAYHPEDFLHRFAKQVIQLNGPEAAARFPVINDDGTPRWSNRWPLSRINAKAAELGPLEFARQMLCKARDDAESRFKREWIDVCLANGNGSNMSYALEKVPPGYRTITGVDLAIQKSDAADRTALVTIAVGPDGTRNVLAVESGKWSGPEIIAKIVQTHERYHSVVIIENNAAQDYLLQFTRAQSAVPIKPFTTGRNKAHPEFGVESIAAEMANGKWSIPNMNGQAHPEILAWIDEMMFYSPLTHTGDRLMASWFAREGIRMIMHGKVQSAPVSFSRR